MSHIPKLQLFLVQETLTNIIIRFQESYIEKVQDIRKLQYSVYYLLLGLYIFRLDIELRQTSFHEGIEELIAKSGNYILE